MISMKMIFLFLLFSVSAASHAQNNGTADTLQRYDVSSVGGIIETLYAVISGPAGHKRNPQQLKDLFRPEARMISVGINPKGELMYRAGTVDEYIERSFPVLESRGFFENEIGRKTEQFGNIVHVFSTYESRSKLQDAKPFMRGINSIQLMFDGKRWWIVNIIWQSEGGGVVIPEKYLER
jgi:hypothetical protein